MKREKPLKPMVKTPNLISKGKVKQREGRGFSMGELKEAGLSVKEAIKLGIYVDKRRRSTHEHNVKALKELKESFSPEPSRGSTGSEPNR